MNETKRSRYGRTAWFYEWGAHVFSAGKIKASKAWQIQWLKPGQRVLYVGAGNGEDVIMAARLKVLVTVVELSPEMLERLENKLRKLNLLEYVNLVCGDAYEHKTDRTYDAVVANYFLNVFSEEVMKKMLQHLASLIRKEGLLLIADFAPAAIHPINRFFQMIYYYSAVSIFHLIAKNPFHRIYDYEMHLNQSDLTLIEDKRLCLFGLGTAWYRSMKVKKLT